MEAILKYWGLAPLLRRGGGESPPISPKGDFGLQYFKEILIY